MTHLTVLARATLPPFQLIHCKLNICVIIKYQFRFVQCRNSLLRLNKTCFLENNIIVCAKLIFMLFDSRVTVYQAIFFLFSVLSHLILFFIFPNHLYEPVGNGSVYPLASLSSEIICNLLAHCKHYSFA